MDFSSFIFHPSSFAFRPLRMERTLFVDSSVRVRPEEIALRLREVRGQTIGSIGIIVRQRAGKR